MEKYICHNSFLQKDICAAPSKIPNIFVIPIFKRIGQAANKKNY
jgi:hypothetical protein